MVDKIDERTAIGWDVVDVLASNDPVKLSSRAKALQACKGKGGCDFAQCVEKALGTVPISVKKACPAKYPIEAAERVTPPRRRTFPISRKRVPLP